jgi:hypothetical protein
VTLSGLPAILPVPPVSTGIVTEAYYSLVVIFYQIVKVNRNPYKRQKPFIGPDKYALYRPF